MRHITIFGTRGFNLQKIVESIRESLTQAQIPFQLNIVSDIDSFIDCSLDAIPAIQLENGNRFYFRKYEHIEDYIEHVVSLILKDAQHL